MIAATTGTGLFAIIAALAGAEFADHCAVRVRDCFTKLAAPHAAFHATIGPGRRSGRGFRYSVPAAILSKPFKKKLE